MLKHEHATVEKLFKRFEDAGDRAFKTKRDLVDRMIEELSLHASIEERVFYPVTRATVPDVEDDTLESLEEHHLVKVLLAELEGMEPEDERFDAKVTVLIENVRHHVEEEEGDYFHKVRDALGRNDLNDIGDAMDEARKHASKHPHPFAPDTPPANVAVGNASRTVEDTANKATKTLRDATEKATGVAEEIISRIRGARDELVGKGAS